MVDSENPISPGEYDPNLIPEGELDKIPRTLVWRLSEMDKGCEIPPHRHRRAQMLYASEGVMTVTTERGVWVVPPNRAVWVPGGRDHAVYANTALSLKNLYIDGRKVGGLPEELCVVAVPRLLRELILEAVTLSPLYDEAGADGRLASVILDRIRSLDVVPLHLPLPAGSGVSDVAAAILAHPEDGHTLETWASEYGMSARTLARRFQSETSMTFGQWRQQARLLEALRRLANGDSVTAVALDLGYESQSAFIAMFRKALGKTPGKYFSNQGLNP